MSDTPAIPELTLIGDLLDALDDGALLYGPDARLRWANRRARALLGLGDTPLAGRSEAELHDLLAGRGVRFADGPVAAEDGAPQLARRRHPLPGGGHLDLYREIESPQAVRRAVLEIALHDLRSPVASIRSYAGMLASGRLGGGDPKVKKAGESMARNLDKALTTARDYLDSELARVGPPPLFREERDLTELVRAVAAARSAPAAERGVAVELRLPPGPVPLSVDGERLEQALATLLDLALARSPTGGSVTLALESFAHEIQIAVTDRGPALSEAELQLAFDRDARIVRDKRLQPAVGLAAARATAAAHGGALGLAACADETTFHLALPR